MRVDVVDLFAQRTDQGFLTKTSVDIFLRSLAVQLQVQDRHRNVRGRHANRVARQFAGEFWQCLGNRGGCASFSQDHVQRGSASTARTLVEVIDEVLVIGVSVDGFNVAMVDTVLVVNDFQYRGNGVGGTRCCGDDLVVFGDVFGIDTVDNVFEISFTRSGQDDL